MWFIINMTHHTLQWSCWPPSSKLKCDQHHHKKSFKKTCFPSLGWLMPKSTGRPCFNHLFKGFPVRRFSHDHVWDSSKKKIFGVSMDGSAMVVRWPTILNNDRWAAATTFEAGKPQLYPYNQKHETTSAILVANVLVGWDFQEMLILNDGAYLNMRSPCSNLSAPHIDTEHHDATGMISDALTC